MSWPLGGLSIVIPAYNEAERIDGTLDQVHRFALSTIPDFEILVVDDGSVDDTAGHVEVFARRDPRIRLIRNERNRGKGYSVRRGALESTKEYVLFTDADNSTPIEEALSLARVAHPRALVIASRALDQSRMEVPQPWYRRLMGVSFRFIVQALVVPGIQDTQCGFKLFGREVARAVFPEMTTDGFAFDVELIARAQRLGFEVIEVPVRWIDDRRSRVSPVRDSLRMLRDVWRIRRRIRHLSPTDPTVPSRTDRV